VLLSSNVAASLLHLGVPTASHERSQAFSVMVFHHLDF